MESDLPCFDFPIFLVDFVAYQDDGYVFENASEIVVPLGHVFVGDATGDIEHNNGGIGSEVVSFS